MVTPLLAALAPTAMEAVSRLLDRIIPDPEQKAKALLELQKEENQQVLSEMQIALQQNQMQADINKIEAGSADLFISGWRPFIGWVCGVAFAYHFVLQPILAFAIANAGGEVKLPVFDMDALFTVLMGMLGLGGLRTIEKIRGRAK